MMPSWARYDTWNVGIAALDHPLRDVRELLPLRNIRWLAPQPPSYFLADPFPYRYDGRDWLLVEEYGHPKGVHGRISRVDLRDEHAPVVPAIARARHISYPYTFCDGPHVYCAPEMSQEDGCVLYLLHADGHWEPRHHVLRGRRVVDPTIFRHGDRWWLFATEPPPLHNRVLHAFYADSVEGPWTAHARNPLKRDLTAARPAGRPFVVGDRLFRPAQDCSETYGGAVNVMEIGALSPDEFSESAVLRLEPDPAWPYPHGLHHLVVDGTRVYFDAKRTRYGWPR